MSPSPAPTPTPTLRLNLTPKCDDSGHLTSLSARLTLGGLEASKPLSPNEPVFIFRNETTGSASQDVLAARNVRVEDAQGPMTASAKYNGDSVAIHVHRHTQGDIHISFDTHPQHTRSLRRNNGGLVGVGTFLPRPCLQAKYAITIAMTSDANPALPIKMLTSLGDGTFSTTGTPTTLQETIFMLGNIQSHQDDAPSSPSATFWLSPPPPRLHALADQASILAHLSTLFKDKDCMSRVFLARTPTDAHALHGQQLTTSTNILRSNIDPAGPMAMAKAYHKFNTRLPTGLASAVAPSRRKATSLTSILIEYDDDTQSDPDWAVARLLNKSIVQRWTQLDPQDDATPNDWFSEGLSNWYSICLPLRFHRDAASFRASLNAVLTSYFTNPHLGTPLSHLPSESTTWHVDTLLESLSCIYMMRMDCLTRRASVSRGAATERPIDDIVADMGIRRRRGETVQEKDWVEYLGEWIGKDEARRHLEEMRSGKVLDLADMKTAFGGIDSVQGRVMQMGFDRRSLTKGVVDGVVEGSNAHQAGLKNGDDIVWHSRVSECEWDCGHKFTIRVRRDGQEREIEYLPRGQQSVKMWRSMEKKT